MSVRILSFGKNLKHLNICIDEKIIGFKHMFSQSIEDDLLYIVIKTEVASYCCARATISFAVDYNPWDQPELYTLCHRIKDIEFCNPFSLKFLENTSAGKAWALAFIQSSKIIKDKDALNMLHENFQNNITSEFYRFTEEEINPPKKKVAGNQVEQLKISIQVIAKWFRDNFVSKEDIEHYYKVAPMIVQSINKLSNSKGIYNDIYQHVISVCLSAIEQKNYDFAYKKYKDSVLELESIYVVCR